MYKIYVVLWAFEHITGKNDFPKRLVRHLKTDNQSLFRKLRPCSWCYDIVLYYLQTTSFSFPLSYCGTHFSRFKLLDTYYEAYQHTFNPNEKKKLAQVCV